MTVINFKSLGIKKIIIYDNNELNDEYIKDALENYIKKKLVEIIDVRGFDSIQIPVYNHCYKNYRYQFDYISFLDLDEYIIINNNSNINDFIYREKFFQCESILLNWVMFGDNDLIKYDKRSMLDRFVKPYIKLGRGKCIVRTDISNLIIITGHIVGVNVKYFCDSNGNKIIPKFPLDFNVPKNTEAYIKHFYTKTVEEFCTKINRGDGNFNKDIKIVYFRIKAFMSFNKITKEKLNMLENCTNLKLNKFRLKINSY